MRNGDWNDPADDNSPGYFDYINPHVYEEWCDWDGWGNDGLCCDPYLSDVADGEPALSRQPGLTVTDVPDRSLPVMPELDGQPEVPLYGFREPIPGARQFSCTGTPMPDDIKAFGSGHPWTSRISQITLMKGLAQPCLDPGSRSRVLLCSHLWTPHCRMVPKLEPWHFRRLRISPVTVLESPERPCPYSYPGILGNPGSCK